ncbi:fimbrial protein [Escherichia coli]|uniref:fimbrial protein n=1 Tax=Escherichia coli TaxID=562 RepID=UPI0006CA64E6|nr:hypothetical protein [Escherichia coli]
MIKSTGALLLFAALSAGQAMASDVAFRGNLLDRPCHVSGDSLNKHVVFKTRASRDFWYPPGRSPTESFVIRLENCHATAVGKIVTLTFFGAYVVATPEALRTKSVVPGDYEATATFELTYR